MCSSDLAMVPNYQYGLFSRDSWLSVLIGQGIIPEGYDRLADASTLPALEEQLTGFRTRIQTNVASMSAHGAFIATYCAAAGVVASEEAAVAILRACSGPSRRSAPA